MVDCPKCGGTGLDFEQTVRRLLDDKTNVAGLKECSCQKIANIFRVMPMRLQRIPKGKIQPSHVKLTEKNMIRWSGEHLLFQGPTLQFELVMKVLYNAIGLKKLREVFIRWTTDHGITQVSVGAKSARNQPGGKTVTYEGLTDGFIDTPDILIIELGKQLMKNRAAAQALEETLVWRLDNRKPVWLLRSHESPWTQNSVTWSESNQLLVDRMEAVNLVKELGLKIQTPVEQPGLDPEPASRRMKEEASSWQARFGTGIPQSKKSR
jgi:hypothetical protein